MKYLFLLIALSSLESVGQTLEKRTFIYEDRIRNYQIYIPEIYFEKQELVPLLINLHGGGLTSERQIEVSNFESIADTANFIIIAPNALEGCFLAGDRDAEVSYMEDLLDVLSEELLIDKTRIYSTGLSNGGYFSSILACQLSNKIAAIAPVAGLMDVRTLEICNPQRPIPVMIVMGTNDHIIPYNQADWTAPGPSVHELIDYWVGFNQCNSAPTARFIGTANGWDVIHYKYLEGLNGSSVEHLKVIDGNHWWPPYNKDNGGINVSAEIWNFLSQFDTFGRIGDLENREIRAFPNPTERYLNFDGNVLDNLPVSIFSVDGTTYSQKKLQNGSVDLGDLSAGMYVLQINDHSFRVIKY